MCTVGARYESLCAIVSHTVSLGGGRHIGVYAGNGNRHSGHCRPVRISYAAFDCTSIQLCDKSGCAPKEQYRLEKRNEHSPQIHISLPRAK